MKFSENWLRSLVDVGASREELCRRLTMAGLEVESVEALGAGLQGVVVAEILSADRHPAADKLQVCRVSVGSGEPLQIVCGAPNARAGLKAPLATVGARLPNGTEIKAAALRGVESRGMLCSAKELALDADASGLLELPVDAPVGNSLSEWLGLPDAAIEIKLTPNRPDCLGMLGLASEVATLFDARRTLPSTAAVPSVITTQRTIRLDAPADCPRYVGRAIEDIDTAARTPVWMAERLRRAGVRPISAVVDCTNYVMLELGQPMHAFDLDRLEGDLIVRRARAGERLKLLDERDVVLDPEFLVVADARQAVAVAGVMGGHGSRVVDSTRRVFLEAAHFAPAAIVGRARKLGLHTDASHRFERGVDPELPVAAVERLTALLVEIAGGRPGPLCVAEQTAALPKPPLVNLRTKRVQRVLGMPVADDRILAILRGLDMQVEVAPEGWRARPPSRRFDIAIEEDLIEEVVRVNGYERVPTTVPAAPLIVEPVTETRVDTALVRRTLIERGYSECINFAFVHRGLLRQWSMADGALALANPLSEELGVMRTALLPGLFEAARRNSARQLARIRLFEIGKVFRAGPEAPIETLRVAGLALGRAAAEHWGEGNKRLVDFFDLKGDAESLFSLAGGGFACSPRTVPDGDWPEWLHPGRSAIVHRGQAQVGYLGSLHPRLAQALDLKTDALAFEFDLEPLVGRTVPRAAEISKFPGLRRDIAVVVPRSVPFAAVEGVIRQAAGPLLKDWVLFDQYTGAGLGADTRSLAIGLILQDDSRTLTDHDADQVVGDAVAALAREFGAVLRG